MDKLQVATNLRNAADHLRQQGWTQSKYFDRYADSDPANVPSCAVGSYLVASGVNLDSWMLTQEIGEVEAMLNELFEPVFIKADRPGEYSRPCNLPDFNDSFATKLEDVTDLFEGMALQLEIEVLAEDVEKPVKERKLIYASTYV